MINPQLPMYDSDGREWVALRMPDGSVFSTNTDDACFLASCNSNFMLVSFENGHAPRGSWKLSNTKPQKDWEVSMRAWAPVGATRQLVDIRAGYRNGVAFAEVVE